jgi:hypothetical protein
MNELVVQDAKALSHFIAVATEAQAQARILKFVKGKYFVGEDEVPIGRQYVAHVLELRRGWVKFKDGKVVDQRIGSVADGFNPPTRDELGDLDKTQWEIDGGIARDPWRLQYFLVLEDVETGELLTFVTGSHGGRTAIGRLSGQFARNVRNGSPIVKLAASSYRHKLYGRVDVPEFTVTGWTGLAASLISGKAIAGAELIGASTRDDMDDDIPF